MDLTRLSRVSDSHFGEGSEAKRKKRADAARQVLKQRLRRKLMDTENTEDVIEAAIEELSTEAPEDVLAVTVEILDDVVENLTEAVEDSKRELSRSRRQLQDQRRMRPRRKKSDAATKSAFRKKLMDTETTNEVVQAAIEELETTDPATVVETVIEVLDDVIENLTNEE